MAKIAAATARGATGATSSMSRAPSVAPSSIAMTERRRRPVFAPEPSASRESAANDPRRSLGCGRLLDYPLVPTGSPGLHAHANRHPA